MSGGSVTITIRSAPFERDPPDADRFYAAVGRAMLLWGRFEMGLDHALLGIVALRDAGSIGVRPEEGVPATLNQKARMWRRAFTTLPALSDMKSAALQLMDDAMEAAEDRAVFAHATWQGFISTEPLVMRFRRIRYKGANTVAFTCDVELSEVHAVQRTFDALNTRMIPIAWNLAVMCNAEPGA